MATLTRHFWGWDRPVLEYAVRYLTQGHAGGTALDLGDTLLIVPTSEAGRRLKESLARAIPAGVLVPWVWTSEQALLPATVRKTVATPIQSQMAWQQAVRRMKAESLSSLFPNLPQERGWLWELELARLLGELHSLLGAAGLEFADVPEHAGAESGRWRDLEKLAQSYVEILAGEDLLDAQAARFECARAPQLPDGVRRVVVLAAPDLPPLFYRWLSQCPVDEAVVAIQATPDLAETFDELGRPLPTQWGQEADLVLPLAEDQLHLCHDASTQAERVTDLLRELAPRLRVAVGIGDPEVGAVLHEKLDLEGVRVFEPGGVAPQQTGLWHVLQQIRALVETQSWRAFASLLRVDEVRKAWAKTPRGSLAMIEKADAFGLEHMPVTIDHAVELLETRAAQPELLAVLQSAQAMVRVLQEQPLLKAARHVLIQLYGERNFSPDAPKDQWVTALGDAWLDCCRQVSEETERFRLNPSPEEALALSLEALAKTALSENRGEVDLVLQGWLELLWEPAPALVVAGLNEEFVPGILIAHPFLPDQLREQLGLPCQASRFARDAYTLRALTEQRAGAGALHVLCGQWSERGEALRPSRLLFLCEDAHLPRRVKHLFPKDEAGENGAQEPVRTVAWSLQPRVMKPKLETISPSRLRSYLDCPFRDYLSQELRMEAVDAEKRELDPAEFGTLIHHALQQLAHEDHLCRSVDAQEIGDFLVEMALQQAQRLYGKRPAPLIGLQLESLQQRLRYAAETEAAEREQGWMIYQAEWEPSPEQPLLIEGARLKCKVDRIERHERSGHIRVLDFKTSDRVTEPLAAHARKLSARSRIAEAEMWKCFQMQDGKVWQWKDLQLPLYAAALRLHGLRPQEVGYFTLPKNVQETKVLTWEDFSDEWVDQALATAGEIVRRMRDGVFWPPGEKARDRGFDEIFLGDLSASVTWPGQTE